MRAVQAALAAACREACQAGAGAPTLRAGGAGSGCGAGGKVRPWLGRAQHLAPLATDRTLATAPDPAPPPLRAPAPDPDAFPPARVRTFALIAHVDHGKSTLADRMMQATGAIAPGARAQYLDRLQVERDRGITVKAQAVSLVHTVAGVPHLLNLVDTPGHCDFQYEVSRALAACQGAALLVDACQGPQAQTMATRAAARRLGLALVQVLTKCDVATADPGRVRAQLDALFGGGGGDGENEAGDALNPPILTSARSGQGVGELLDALVARVPPPPADPDPAAPLRALIFDAHHDPHRGVVLLVALAGGSLARGGRVELAASGTAHDVVEVGMLTPEPTPVARLGPGHVGYVVCGGLKSTAAVRVGDTLRRPGSATPPLPGFRPALPSVYAGLYPATGGGLEALAAALDRLTLNDASVSRTPETSVALGPGFRCGFLGALHMEVFMARLEQEYGADVIATPPVVPYLVRARQQGGGGGGGGPGPGPRSTPTPPPPDADRVTSAAAFPRTLPRGTAVWEPTVAASVLAPADRLGPVMELCQARRGELLAHEPAGGGAALLRYRLPLAELGNGLVAGLKAATAGYASFDYEDGGYRRADLVRLDLLLNGEPVDALARVVARVDAARAGRDLAARCAAAVGRQQFEVAVQAAADGRVVARETVKAMRKDVTAKCYGGDVSRKKKLLKKQKEGKARMRRLGRVDVPADAFRALVQA